MSTKRKNLALNTTSVNLGCSRRKTRLFKIFPSKPNPKPQSTLKNILFGSSSSPSSSLSSISSSRSSSTFGDYTSTTTTSYHIDDTISHDTESGMKSNGGSSSVSVKLGLGRVGGEGIAIEKDSDDPYLDFKHSMLQMIVENEIYSKDDLRQLLKCFLMLNSPYFHGTIIEAFTEIWNGVFSSRSAPMHHHPRVL